MTTNRKNQHPAAIDAEKPTNLKTKTRRAAALLLMLLMLAPLAARAQEEYRLTVFDGGDALLFPLISYFNRPTVSQYIIPAAYLTEMAGDTVKEMRFYPTSAINYSGTYDVYFKEVDYTFFRRKQPPT